MSTLPQSADCIKEIFQEAGIKEYEPQLPMQVCDIAYAMTKQVLQEARAISEFSGKKQIDKTDVEFALKAFNEKYHKDRPPKSFMAELASEKNAQPLPPIRQNYGMRLPNDRFCQLQPNYAHIGSAQQSTSDLRSAEPQQEPQTSNKQPTNRSNQMATNNFNPEIVSNMILGRPLINNNNGAHADRKRPYTDDDSRSEQADAEDDYD